MRNITELRQLVSQVDADKKVEVGVTRQGKPVTVTAQIKEQPANYQLARAQPPDSQGQPVPPSPNEPDQEEPEQNKPTDGPLASIEVRELTPQLAQSLGVPPSVHGVVVSQVGENSAQLRPGDVIEAVNQEPISSVQEYESAIQRLDSRQPQVLSVCRHRTRSFVGVQPR